MRAKGDASVGIVAVSRLDWIDCVSSPGYVPSSGCNFARIDPVLVDFRER